MSGGPAQEAQTNTLGPTGDWLPTEVENLHRFFDFESEDELRARGFEIIDETPPRPRGTRWTALAEELRSIVSEGKR